ncbi:MAG: DUF4012 domain-containing protein [Candidatus Kerfeldbacteria bacterium]|nr:DUF4012 domain-containing protein [Candidatus Kerfeldbacteria bacterium]
MPNTDQNRHPKRKRNSKSRHGRVIDLRSLVALHRVREASSLTQETERYARYVNGVLRKAFAELLYGESAQDSSRQGAHSASQHADEKHLSRKSLIRISWTRNSVVWNTITSTAVFAVIALLIVVPVSVSALVKNAVQIKDTASAQAERGVDSLVSAAEALQSFDFASAHSEFSAARDIFTQTSSQIRTQSQFLLTVAKALPFTSTAVNSGEELLTVGVELSSAGTTLSESLDAVASLAGSEDAAQVGLVPVLQSIHSSVEEARRHLYTAQHSASQVSEAIIPTEYKAVFTKMNEALPALYEQMGSVQTLVETVLTIAGTTGEKSYLFLFQNNHEMRPTGGFIGSIAIVYVNDGEITSIDVPPGGIYDIAGQLNEKVSAPLPLQLVTPYWNIQDANWFPHFPVSAEKVNSFYEKITHAPVDGIFTFTPAVLESLLNITGPIDLTQDFGITITVDNVYDELQTRAEEKYAVTAESKKIIGVLAAAMMEKLGERIHAPTDLVTLAQVLRDALTQKQILAYMTDATTQKNLSSFDWAGELKTTDRDYVFVNYANIHGGKTDSNMDRTVTHEARISANGSVHDTVTIRLVHDTVVDKYYENVPNISYVRVYVPEGATLDSVSGFEEPNVELYLRPEEGTPEDVDLLAVEGDVVFDADTHMSTHTEFGKTVFGGFMITPVGEESIVTLKYTLPFTLNVGAVDHYSLLVQKQPGNFPEKDILKTRIDFPSTWDVHYSTSALYGSGDSIPMYTDQLFGLVFSKT